MKSAELIRLLQEEDPTGEIEVSVGNTDIYFLTTEPAYYDGCQQLLIRDESKKPYYHIAGVKYVSSGQKIVLHTLSSRDVLLNDPDALLDYSDLGEQRAEWYRQHDEKTREQHRNLELSMGLDAFFNWAKKKASMLEPEVDLDELRDVTDNFYHANLSPKDPLKELPLKPDKQGNQWQASINDRRESGWDDAVEVKYDGYWRVEKKLVDTTTDQA